LRDSGFVKSRLGVMALLAVAVGGILVLFCPFAKAEKIALELSPKIGETTWYRIKMDGTTEISGSVPGAPAGAVVPGGGAPIPIQITIVYSVAAKPRDEDSNWVFEQKVHDFKMLAMGMDMSQMLSGLADTPITITQDKYGNVVKVQGLQSKGGGMMSPANLAAITLAPRMLSFPKEGIEIGDTWKPQAGESAMRQIGQSGAEVQATLVSLEDVDGQKCAQIKVASKANPELKGALPGMDDGASAKAESDLLFTVRTSDCEILKMTGEMTTKVVSGSKDGFGAKTEMNVEMEKIQPPVEADAGSERTSD
jgi:hypothetical protein